MTTSQVMVLTGCASGIGRHLTRALAQRGHRIVATDVDESGLSQRAREDGWPADRVRTRRLDVRSEVEWEAALDDAEAWGGVDVVMNVAGFLRPGWIQDLDVRDVDLHLDVNVKGTILGTRAAARRMLVRGRGHIINFGSLASLAAVPGLGLYTASKFAVRGFSLAVDTELRPRGVAVSLIMPDAVQTPMLDLQVGYEEAAMTFSGSRPLTVEDVERLVVEVVLPKRPLEVAIPLSRAAAARFANALPEAARTLTPLFTKKGRKAQERRKRAGPASG
jgi:3-oxoacyl-[acyl-carrier protein] reductase